MRVPTLMLAASLTGGFAVAVMLASAFGALGPPPGALAAVLPDPDAEGWAGFAPGAAVLVEIAEALPGIPLVDAAAIATSASGIDWTMANGSVRGRAIAGGAAKMVYQLVFFMDEATLTLGDVAAYLGEPSGVSVSFDAAEGIVLYMLHYEGRNLSVHGSVAAPAPMLRPTFPVRTVWYTDSMAAASGAPSWGGFGRMDANEAGAP